MLKSTVFFVFLWTLQATFAEEICQDPCSCKFSDGTYIDLSAVGKKDGIPRFFMLPGPENDSHLFSYNPCYPFSYRAEDFKVVDHACIGAAACIITPGNSSGSPPTQQAIGYQNSAKFFLDNSGIVRINYTVPGDGEKVLTVNLTCNSTVMHELEIYDQTSFVLSTMCACKNASEFYKAQCQIASHSSKSGLSTGSILLITFFVILLVYVGFGILFNFCKGAHGTELFPNYEFWNELPKLIVDGFLFTCSCFGRRSSYADV